MRHCTVATGNSSSSSIGRRRAAQRSDSKTLMTDTSLSSIGFSSPVTGLYFSTQFMKLTTILFTYLSALSDDIIILCKLNTSCRRAAPLCAWGNLFTKGRKPMSHMRRSYIGFAMTHVIHETNRWCDSRRFGRKLCHNLRRALVTNIISDKWTKWMAEILFSFDVVLSMVLSVCVCAAVVKFRVMWSEMFI